MALGAFDQFGGSEYDPTQNQQVQRWAARMRQQSGGTPATTATPSNPYPTTAPPTPPQPSAPPQPPQTTAPTQPPPQQPPTQPQPSAPAPTWRNTEDSWINFLGTQGLQGTRPGFFGQGANSVQDMVARFNKMTGQNARYVGGPSGDLVDFGDGRGPVDVRTAQGEFWYSEPGQGQPGGPGGGGRAPGAPGLPPPPGGLGGPGTGLSNQDRYNQLYDMLMKRATQGLDVSAENPQIKAQTDAANAAMERERRRNLADLAERGGANVNLSAETRMTGEDVGQRTAQLQAGLMGQELAAKRNEIAQSLAQMGDLLTTQQKLALQRELQLYDNAIRQQQLAQQQSQFESQLGFNIGDREAYWDYMNGMGSLG